MHKTFIFLLALFLAACLGTACMVPSARKTSVPTPAAEPAPTPKAIQEPDVQDPPPQAPKEDQSSVDTALRIVRVQLADNQKSAYIKHSGRVYVYTQDVEKKYKVSAPGTLEARMLGNGKIQVGSLQSTQSIIIEPTKDTLLTWNGNVYAGKIVVVPAQYTFLLVEHADLENYLYGVLPYEMSYSWPLEALKAQAVAARTYTLKTLEDSKNKFFDLYSDVRSQMYKGGGKQYDSVRSAVDATKNKVLTFNDKLFYTYYHGNCGGGTDNVNTWNTTAKSIKPLAGSSCGYDTHSKNYTWKTDLPFSKVLDYAKGIGLVGKLKNVKVSGKTHTGRATHLTIRTSKGEKRILCNKFRLAVGLKSCKINQIKMLKKQVHFEGRGYGHGIGMCQDGAYGMAKAGKTYEQILKNYYPGAKLTAIK